MLDRLLRAGEGRILRKLAAIARQVNAIEEHFVAMSDAELREMADELKSRRTDGESLDSLLPESFATVREAARRTLGQRHFDVQIMGGAALHLGNIAEMKTGEGKTLVSTLPAFLNALDGKGVHIVTTNDYLARRDAENMGRVHRFLGLTVGVISPQMDPAERRAAYACDITYGTNNEFGFDYLRDNMAWSAEELVQRGHHFAIVDEVDSILIDEARTPLIISGPADQATQWYTEFARIAPRLIRDADYEVDEGKRTIAITESGIEKVEDQLGIDNLYEAVNTPLVGYLNNALKAQELYKRDRDYIVANGEVLIVDEFTGRVLAGRRYSEGMHQAIEAKEHVAIKDENQTLATITLQNFFRLYTKLAGMTGTAMTEASEFAQIYSLGVVPIPTNRPMIRVDNPDVVYQSEDAKFEAVVEDLAERYERGQPVLVGTTSVEKSERLSGMLLRRGVPHQVLNAKQNEREAAVIAQAGRKGAITVATNMAGRGTDIMLGGNPEFSAAAELRARGLSPVETPEDYEAAWPEALEKAQAAVSAEHDEVVALGGLYVLGTERHESRRIDNQLRGRSGRQGDPGESRFYLSLGDDLMRMFNSNAVESIMARLNIPEEVPIESKLVTRAIRSAQTQVESQNFEIRKNVLKYDEVLNRQRSVIYEERRKVLDGADLHEQVRHMIDDVVTAYVQGATAEGFPEDWDLAQLWTALRTLYPVGLDVAAFDEERHELTAAELTERLLEDAQAAYSARERELGEEVMRDLERRVILSVLDRRWREHLYEMDYLQEGIGLRAMGQRDPLVEYQREGFDLFATMMDGIKEESVGFLFHVEVRPAEPTLAASAPVTVVPAGQAAPAPGLASPATPGGPDAGSSAAARAAEEPLAVPQGVPLAAESAGFPPGDQPLELNEARAEVARPVDHAGGGAAGESSHPRVVLPADLVSPRRPTQLSYTAPTVDGAGGTVTVAGPAPGLPAAAPGPSGRVGAAGRPSGSPARGRDSHPGQVVGSGPARNQPCPCGSGRKYKRCHGAVGAAG